jgi:hypothetical protein
MGAGTGNWACTPPAIRIEENVKTMVAGFINVPGKWL